MSRWFRFYDRALDDPKVQRLAPDVFKGWVNLLCLAARNGGRLPSLSDIAFALRITDREADSLVTTLLAAGLIDDAPDGMSPHRWSELQFTSDKDPTGAERQRKFRERHKDRDVTRYGAVTSRPPEAETDTEAEQQNAREARDAAPPDDHADLKLTLRHAAGLDDADAPGLEDVSPILDLMAKGYSLADRILPVLGRKRAAFAKPGSWAYFVPAIVEAEQKAGGIAAAKTGTPAASVWIVEGSPAWASVTKARGKPPLKSYQNGQAGAWVRADELKGQAA